ncbi:hypothetical protein H7X46_24875 [Pseudonocardia sp. C8]|uniref:hypothetical protein n=1 Tax=Pseudonocardia sp. C8 TaxID=2762759 RepID=UPI001643536B|nr:hypothetical protein [Pseudonocardia sp. C8]MBC3194290.1 hypothetical protein [Pseudonocardia sp. C8]
MTTDTLAGAAPAPDRTSGGTVASACPSSSPGLGVGERPHVPRGDVGDVVGVVDVIPCTLGRP